MVLTRDVHKNPILLFSTDITIPPVKIIEYYSARWKIEIAFRDLKEMGKMSDYRVRNKDGMTKHITLCFVAHTLLRILQFQKIQFNVQPVHRPWHKKAKLSMGQIRGMVQNENMLQIIFGLLGRLGISYEKDIVINEFNELHNTRNKNQYESELSENG
jgi:transposase